MSETTVPEKKAKYASAESVEKLTSQLDSLAGMVSKLVDSVQSAKPTPSVPATAGMPKEDGGADITMIPPAWRKIVDEKLGSDFGINVVWPGEGNNTGVLFKVIVPLAKSNMAQDERQIRGIDVRTRNLSGNPSLEEVNKFVEKIRLNLLATQTKQLVK